MNGFFQSFYFKISIVFVVLVFALSAAQLSISADVFSEFERVLEQELKQFVSSNTTSQILGSARERLRESVLFKLGTTGIFLMLLATLLLGLLLFSILTRRIRSMTRTVSQFERGELEKRMPEKSGDELGRLGKAFNEMAAQIEKQIEELKTTDRLRRELVSNVSHDLRTPLTSMRGYLETVLMKEGDLSEEQRKEYLQIVLSNTESLQKQVSDLFELSKLEARQRKPKAEVFRIEDLANDVMQKFAQRAREKNVLLQIDAGKELPSAFADIALMDRVLSNLVENAIKFTESSGEVRIEVKKNADGLAVSVIDSGVGISENAQPYIFDYLYRAAQKSGETEGGAGIGLAIVKKILEAHGSQIEVKSAPGKGSAFVFALPICDSL